MEALQVPDDCKEMCRRLLSRKNQYLDYVKSSLATRLPRSKSV